MASLFSYKATCALVFSFIYLYTLCNNASAKHGYHGNNPRHHHPRGHSSHSSALNPQLQRAYIALQAWKRVIYSDPHNFTANWVGKNVCNYRGVYCAPYPDDPSIIVVAGIDLNFADIAGFLPNELGLLSELALIHLNSNRFCGIIPESISNLSILFELDLSNNRFVGPFPNVVLSLPNLKYLDLRFNEFEGPLPPELFRKQLDAIFVNNNRFTNVVPSILGGSTASVIVIANNNLQGCLPTSIATFADTLEELLIINTNLTGCLPPEVGYLYKLRVLDVSHNNIVGPIPYSLSGLAHLEVLNLGHNLMTGLVPGGVCILPNLSNFTFSYNFFCEEEGICMNLTSRGITFDDRRNCLPDKPNQRSAHECNPVLEHPVDCFQQKCATGAFTSTPALVPAASPSLSPSIAPSSS